MSNEENALDWFRFAEMDLSSAEFLMNMHPLPCGVICYHCQQAAEKFLKGVLCQNNSEIPRTHNLIMLIKLCSGVDKSVKELEQACYRLEPFSTVSRYPGNPQITQNDMMKAVRDAKHIKSYLFEIGYKVCAC